MFNYFSVAASSLGSGVELLLGGSYGLLPYGIVVIELQVLPLGSESLG
jgi:hypothetical protein